MGKSHYDIYLLDLTGWHASHRMDSFSYLKAKHKAQAGPVDSTCNQRQKESPSESIFYS